MGREYLIQRALAPVYPYVARMVGLCRDESVIGSEFYVMERLDGTILRKELPFELSPRRGLVAVRARVGGAGTAAPGGRVRRTGPRGARPR